MQIGVWTVNESELSYQNKLIRAKSPELTPLGIRKDVGFAVFSGKHGIYNTTMDSCNCHDFNGSQPCKHILRLAIEMDIINESFETDISDVKFPQEPIYLTKKIFVDTDTGETFDDRPFPKGPLYDMTIVISGTFPEYTRDDLMDLINKSGGRVSGSVSKKTDFLVVGEEPGSKLTKAQQLGINIINLRQLVEMIEKG